MARILFAGTPDISVPLLQTLAGRFDVVGVLTNCDKPQGRSKTPVAPPVKQKAEELGIPVLQFDTIRTEAREAVSALGADTLVTFAFGRIFGPKFLALFKQTFNVHPSALPVFRGPSPVQAAILAGLNETAISLQSVGLGMDEGDIFAVKKLILNGTETTLSLEERVAQEAAGFVPDVLADIFAGNVVARPQEGEASYCSMIEKDAARLDFNRTVREVHAKIRAMYPWPKASSAADGKDVFLTGVWGGFAEITGEVGFTGEAPAPGTVVGLRKDRGIGIACSDGTLWVTRLQMPGKKEMDFKSFANGNAWFLKSILNG